MSALTFYLKGYDNKLANNLISGFTFGFKLHYRGDDNYKRSSQNLLSAYAHPEIVDSKLKKERELGRIKGPFKQPPFPNFFVSPLGVIPKKTPGEYRMIHHLSFPYGLSVNDSIPREFCTVKYATVDDAINIVKKLGKGCAMAKTDVRNAFRILPVHPSDFHLLGIQWKGKWYYDACLPMGLASSCKHFESFSSAIEWIARNKLGIPHIIHILDDFLIVDKTLSDCGNRLHSFLGLCAEIGIPMAPEKTEGPAHVLTFAGIELDCVQHVARLPRDKIDKCLTSITSFVSRRKVTLRDLQSLIGLLNFACSVITPGRVFLRRLINLTIGVKRPFHYIRLSQEVKKDLRIWHEFLLGFNCKSFVLEDARCTSPSIHFYTDAAKTVGYGIVFGTSWAFGEWPENWKLKDISVLELYPIVVGLIMWADKLTNQQVIFFSDNESVVHVINKQTTKDKALLALLRQLVLACLRYNFLFKARHIAGSKNVLADSLSRLQVEKFKRISQGRDLAPTKIPVHLQPQNWAIP